MAKKKKCLVMFSNGLDSRLAVKIMQEKGVKPLLVYFQLPFSKEDKNEAKTFSKKEKLELKVFDCTKGKLFREYLEVLKKAKHGRGTGMNPCMDCRIFMFKKTKEFADKKGIKIIATGEVTGQRPMSQQKKQIEIIEQESNLKNRIVRPLIDLGFHGRRRDKQMQLAKRFKINYPSPGGGCILCEKELKGRFEFLLKRGISEEELKLVNIGRHFVINGCWVVLGRDEKENQIIETFKGHIEPDFLGPSAVILDKWNKKVELKVSELIKVYSKQGSLKKRGEFERFRL